MLLSFPHLWQQAELSDVDVLLNSFPAAEQQDDALPQKLAEFPGHTALLSSSPYLRAQVRTCEQTCDQHMCGHSCYCKKVKLFQIRRSHRLVCHRTCIMPQRLLLYCTWHPRHVPMQILRWQRKRSHEQRPGAAGVSTRRRTSAKSISSTQQAQQDTSKPQLVLTLQDASEQPAAMAVLATLYGAKPMPELLAELSQEQQLQAAMLADMWQLPAISTAAGDALASTLKVQGKLSEAVTQQLLHLQAMPDCLQPLCKQVLLHLLGNLEQCWADPALRDKLMNLPLASMELLLSCDELKVGY
jgi:hypothetical protein